ncbi:MAG: type II secretion system protein [bacterium]
MKTGFTLIEILVAMVIVLGSALFLLKAIITTQRAIIFSKHKQEAVFLLEERIEEIKSIQWATATTRKGSEGEIVDIKDEDITWYIGGILTKSVGPINFFIIPGTETGIGPAAGRPSVGSGTLDVREDNIFGGTFSVSCAWIEDNKWSTITNTIYIAPDNAFFEESKNFVD